MLIQRFNLNESHKSYFKLKNKMHRPTWDHYYRNYVNAVDVCLVGTKTYINSRAKTFMFFLRHSLELCLKSNLKRNNLTIPNSHNFSEILAAYDTNLLPSGMKEFTSKFDILDVEGDGSLFRYVCPLKDDTEKEIYLTKLIAKHNEIETSDQFHSIKLLNGSKKIKKITLNKYYICENMGLGHIRTQYDYTLAIIIDLIKSGAYEIKDLYLPLLFLIRHSFELALKFNLERLLDCDIDYSESEKEEILKKIKTEHSLHKLFTLFKNLLCKGNFSLLSNEDNIDFEKRIEEYERLNSKILHNLDSHSYLFRYPSDQNGDPFGAIFDNIDLFKILKIYEELDSFITFVPDFLVERGVFEPSMDYYI